MKRRIGILVYLWLRGLIAFLIVTYAKSKIVSHTPIAKSGITNTTMVEGRGLFWRNGDASSGFDFCVMEIGNLLMAADPVVGAIKEKKLIRQDNCIT